MTQPSDAFDDSPAEEFLRASYSHRRMIDAAFRQVAAVAVPELFELSRSSSSTPATSA
ncbi:hypothetical protein [Actinoplanes sp. NPDC020271]|uniref:hypothetical protein n=1 Tax=Actinoplanes sp. NPDC020271 TaxID=3363896 RepID=UPI003787D856